jgi:zinc protease
VEHLWFRAQTPHGSVQERLEDLGVTNNAYTLGDATVYLSQADVALLPDLLELEALRLADPLAGISAEILEQERSIVDSERSLRGLVASDFPRFLPPGFGGNDNGLRPRSASALAAITMDDLQAVSASYVPQTTTILIAGPLESAGVQEMVEAAFPEDQLQAPGGACGGRAVSDRMTPPSLTRRGPLHTTRRDVEEPVVLVGWSLPAAYGSDEPIMRMVTGAMGRRLRSDLSPARFRDSSARCRFVPSPVSSSLICVATVPDGANGGQILEIMTEAGGSADNGIFADARDGVIDIILGLDAQSPLGSDDNLRDVLANHYTGSPMWFADALVGFRQARVGDVAQFLGRWVRPEQAWLSLVVPPAVDVDRVLAGRPDKSGRDVEGFVSQGPMARDTAPEVESHRGPNFSHATTQQTTPSAPVLSEPKTLTMNNGMRMVVLQHGIAPISQVGLVIGGASSVESRLGLDEWAGRLTGVDTSLFDYKRPSMNAEMLGARLWMEDHDSAHVIGLSGVSVSLEDQLLVLRRYAGSTGRVGEGYRQQARFQVRRQARELRRDPVFVQTQAQWVHVLGADSPSAYHPVLLAHRAGGVGLRKVDRHIRALWHPENATLYVVGPDDPDQVITEAIKGFSSWEERRWKPQEQRASLAPVPTTQVSYEVVDDERTTASLRLRCRAPDGSPQAVLEVAAELMREWGQAELRESDIAAYNPSVSLRPVGEATVVSMGVTVDPVHAAAAATVMHAGLGWLADDTTDADAERVARRLRASWTGQFIKTSDVLDHLMEHDVDVATFAESYGEQLMQVDAEQVHNVARSCSVSAALGVITPQAGIVADSAWADVLTEASLPRGM